MKKRLTMLFPVLVMAVIGACAMGPKMQQIRPNMTQEEVVDELGNPDGIRRFGDYTVYTYANSQVRYRVVGDGDLEWLPVAAL